MITRVMWFNMIGQSIYQIIVVMLLLFAGHKFSWLEANKCYVPDDHGYPTDPEECSDDPNSPYVVSERLIISLFHVDEYLTRASYSNTGTTIRTILTSCSIHLEVVW